MFAHQAKLLTIFLPVCLSLQPSAIGGMKMVHGSARARCLTTAMDESELPLVPLDSEDDLPPPSDDDLQCTGRLVSELVDRNGADGKGALPDRFMMAVRAIRGEFSPAEGATDTERTEDSLLTALMTWPANVKLRIVTRPLEVDQADAFVRDIEMLGEAVTDAGSFEVGVKVRGSRRSIDLMLSEVPDAASLSALRESLKADDRVQMVF